MSYHPNAPYGYPPQQPQYYAPPGQSYYPSPQQTHIHTQPCAPPPPDTPSTVIIYRPAADYLGPNHVQNNIDHPKDKAD
ncbi:hypothetical protein DdX_18107 [Ditylenchus destructor]|uniref:Uncharacterized protein n=1 Tax=Ditylenchus destructor TaxID=166010 RepID=A0AAD4QYK8_9BILA|nr:hypothetical protein DdX_18107 [Ditylenchus destructor]